LAYNPFILDDASDTTTAVAQHCVVSDDLYL
jgi:hypothetical protein